MKEAIRTAVPVFCTRRMVKEYTERFYWPSARHYRELVKDSLARGLAAIRWKERVRRNWDDVQVVEVDSGGIETIDYMRAKSTPEEFEGYLRLSALKYLSRVGHKHGDHDAARAEEYKKARWFLDRLIRECDP